MAQTTSAETRMTREELADYLHVLGDKFATGDEEITVEVGNKTVTVTPSKTVDCEIEVHERSSVIRRGRETVDIRLSWKR